MVGQRPLEPLIGVRIPAPQQQFKMKIVAIGGGRLIETKSIDKEVIRLTGKEHPRLLFIPTASSDDESYVDVIQRHFGKRLGCKVNTLYLFNRRPSVSTIKKQIHSADIIYVGGGNTLKMMKRWRRYGVDKMLLAAAKRGAVLTGVSAGSICWFRNGNSDSRRFTDPKADLIKVRGLGLIPALHCPHYDVEKDRKPQLKKMMRNTPGVAIALDNYAALEVIDDKCRIITSKKSAGAYRVYWKGGRYYRDKIIKTTELAPTKDLLRK